MGCNINCSHPITFPVITASGDVVYTTPVQTLTNKSLSDSTTKIVNVTDATKKLGFSLGGSTTAKTLTITSSHTDDRTITFPDATDTIVGKATTDTLTNKTLTTPAINTPVITGGSITGSSVDIVAAGFKIDGTAVSSTAAELNILDGVTSTYAELNILDGVTSTYTELNYLAGITPGTITASKAIVVNSDANLGIAKITQLHIGATGAETQVTSTSVELNYLDGSSPGVVVASKAIVANSDANIGVAKITELHIGATGVEVQVTSTPAELNFLDGSVAGTGVASKAVVLDSNKDIDLGTGDITATEITGEIQTASQPNITGIGTITTGVWTGTDIAVAAGGTGSSTASGALDNLGAGTVGKAIFQDTTAAGVKTELSIDNVENTALSTWAGTTNITTIATDAIATTNIADKAITADKAASKSIVASATEANSTAGIVLFKHVNAADFKALLDTGTNNLFAVETNDILLEVVIHLNAVSTVACNLIVGLDAAAVGALTDTNALITTIAINGGARRSITSYDTIGDELASGMVQCAAAGYVTVTSDANVTADATLVAAISIKYMHYTA